MRVLRSILSTLFVCVSCLEPYAPPVNASPDRMLVVDGYIDMGGFAVVKLTRSMPLYHAGLTPLEVGASVSISSSVGEEFNLTESDSSVYTASGLSVNSSATYSLHIKTASGEEYQSDNVKIYRTPDVGSIYYRVQPIRDAIEIVTDANDDSPDATGFYLIDCIETWEYHSPAFSKFIIVNGSVRERTEEEMVSICWRNQSQPTTLANTNAYSEHMISGHRVSTIEKFSPKISLRYSALVRQRSISREEYEYRDQLLKSTEQLGSLFAVIPGPVASNVRSITNPGEYVLGYFRGQELKEKRAFIKHADLPEDFSGSRSVACEVEFTCPIGAQINGPNTCLEINQLSSSSVVVSLLELTPGVLLKVGFVRAECGDCTSLGGTTTKPAFW